ncbi:MAG: hypothetical protein ACYTEL_22540 [Planctomycetota bacterium]|jgi:hypothetical protein
MEYDPPQGSKIQVQRDMHSTRYLWANKERNFLGYVMAPILFVFLCVWTCAGIGMISDVIDESTPPTERLHRVSGLAAWIVFESGLIAILYLVLRPQKPSVLTLSAGFVEYQTGTRCLDLLTASDKKSGGLLSQFKQLKNRAYKLRAAELGRLKLERRSEKQMLLIDYEGKLIEIGETLSEPEREWLYEILKQHCRTQEHDFA